MPTSLCTYRHCYCCSVDLVDISPLVHINLSRSMLDPQQTVLPLGSSSVNFIFTHTHIYTHTPARMHKKKNNPQGFTDAELRYTVNTFIRFPESYVFACLVFSLKKMHAHLSHLFQMYTDYPQLKHNKMHSMHFTFPRLQLWQKIAGFEWKIKETITRIQTHH